MWFLHYIAGTIGKAQDQHLLVVPVLFCCLKISLNNFTDRVTNFISVVSVRAKRGKNLHALTIFTGRGEIMSPFSFEKAIRLQFDCLIRKVIDRTVKNYYRELGRRAKHEVPSCDVTEADLNHVAIIDE